jgi:hypothetical protein
VHEEVEMQSTNKYFELTTPFLTAKTFVYELEQTVRQITLVFVDIESVITTAQFVAPVQST